MIVGTTGQLGKSPLREIATLGSEGSERLAEMFARQSKQLFGKHSSYGSKHEAILELVCHC